MGVFIVKSPYLFVNNTENDDTQRNNKGYIV